MPDGKWIKRGVLAAILVGLSFMLWFRFSDSPEPLVQEAVYEVKSGPLIIDVVESGTIKAREQLVIKNEVEGKTSILYLIPEGTQVKKGDLLVELDASTLMDAKIDQEIKVQNAEATFVNATETLAVVENQAKSDLDLAKLTLEFARQDLKKYTDGEYPNDLQKARAEITLAQEELARARERLEWSKTLYEEKFISQTELAADELAEKKRPWTWSWQKTIWICWSITQINGTWPSVKVMSVRLRWPWNGHGERPGPMWCKPKRNSRPGKRSFNGRRTNWKKSLSSWEKPEFFHRPTAW